jgi:NAD(P)-dependent dehydrogenase (short-subunit alcohol dehydrogenase family)
MSINLRGLWLCKKHELKQMLLQGSGAIVNCSSMAGLTVAPGLPAYTAAKHGVIGLTRTSALDLSQTTSESMRSSRNH